MTSLPALPMRPSAIMTTSPPIHRLSPVAAAVAAHGTASTRTRPWQRAAPPGRPLFSHRSRHTRPRLRTCRTRYGCYRVGAPPFLLPSLGGVRGRLRRPCAKTTPTPRPPLPPPRLHSSQRRRSISHNRCLCRVHSAFTSAPCWGCCRSGCPHSATLRCHPPRPPRGSHPPASRLRRCSQRWCCWDTGTCGRSQCVRRHTVWWTTSSTQAPRARRRLTRARSRSRWTAPW